MRFDDIGAVEEADRDHDAETREDIRRFRTSSGLPVDDALVEHFLAEYKAERQEEGMWLTAEEWDRYEDQDRVQDEATDRLAGYLASHPESFAGSWLGEGLDPEYNLAFTGDIDRHRDALLKLYPRPDVVKVHPAQYTKAELDAIADRIADETDELAAAGVDLMASGVDAEANRVEVEVTAADEDAARTFLESRYGPAVTCSWQGPEATDVAPEPWQLWTTDEAERLLTVHYRTFAAYELERAALNEDEREVRVAVFVRRPYAVRTIGRTFEATVELSAPLDGRRVVDATTGRIRERRIPKEVFDRSWDLIRAYAAEHPGEYGGSWAEQPGCHVAFTSHVEAHREALLEMLPEPRALVVREVERTEAELLELGARVARERRLLRSHGIHCIEPPLLWTEDNAMHVEIEAKDRDAALRFMADRYGPGLLVSWLPT